MYVMSNGNYIGFYLLLLLLLFSLYVAVMFLVLFEAMGCGEAEVIGG